MTDKSQPDRKKLNPPKHIAVLVLGLLMTGIAEGFALYNPSAYTTGALVFIFLTRPIIYFVLLGVVALIISACRNNVKKFWFPALAWLFFAAGVFDVAMEGYANLILRPQIAKGYYRDRKPDQGSLCDLMIFSGENNAYSIAVDAMKWTYGSDDMPGAEFKFYHRDADIWGFVIPERTTTSITNLRALVISELKNSLSGIEILKNEIGNINDTQVLTLKIRGTIDGLSMIIHRNCYIDADWITHTSIAATEDAYNNHNDDVDCFLNGLIITDNLSTLSKENPLIGHWAGDKNPEMKYFFSANKVHIGQPYRESNEFPYEILDSSSDSIKIRILGYLGSFNMDFIFHGKRNATKVFRLRTAVTEEEIHWVNRMQKP